MRTKQLYITIILLLVIMYTANAQLHYYYYYGKKIEINIDKEFIAVNTSNRASFLNAYAKNYVSKTDFVESYTRSYAKNINGDGGNKTKLKNYYAEVKLQGQSNHSALTDLFKKDINVIQVSPCFTIMGKRLGLTNNFYVKVKTPFDNKKLYDFAEKNRVEVLGQDPFMPEWYFLSCTKSNSKNALENANFFYESGLFAAAEPEFIYHDLQSTADPLYNNQWGLNNTGQNGGTNGLDINAEQAWSITKGNGVRIAIFDHGFEMNHPDLSGNTFGTGFDATTGSSPAQVRGSHGTAVAGIIGATENNIGICGVAPEADVISISINLLFSDTPAQLASGFNWAWQNGIDIINNSWGGYAPSTIITDGIQNALSNGRNGLGTIIVFATGNDNVGVSYPANAISDILAVGGIDRCGIRSGRIDVIPNSCDPWLPNSRPGSNFGSQIDIVAPGTNIPTTDRQGANGYNVAAGTAGDYMLNFNGTSAAAPHVAGVAALILSVDPNLTVQQVNNIIESTAQKTGGYNYSNNAGRPNGTWNNQMGYGLIDANAAVQAALPKIVGPSIICNTATYSLVPSTSATWTTTGPISISGSSTGTSVNVIATGSGAGSATLTATVGMIQVSKNISNASSWNATIYLGDYPSPGVMYTYYDYIIDAQPGYTFPNNTGYYTWSISPGLSNGGELFQYNSDLTHAYLWITDPGYYTVTINAHTPCGVFSVSKFFEAVDNPYDNYYSYRSYPNPASNELIVERQEKTGDMENIKSSPQAKQSLNRPSKRKILFEAFLYNQKGEVVAKGSGTNKAVLNTAHLPDDTYFLHYKNEKGKLEKKQIIIKH